MSEGEGLLRQDELEELFRQSAAAEPPKEEPVPPRGPLGQAASGGPSKDRLSGEAPTAKPGSPPPAAGAAGVDLGDPTRPLKQAEIDRLLEQAGVARTKPAPKPRSEPPPPPPPPEETISPRDLEFLLEQAEKALRSVEEPAELPSLPGLKPFQFEQFAPTQPSQETANLDLVGEVELEVRIELGQARLYLEDVLKLRKGSVVTLDKLAGDPVDIYVNGRLIARGEVLVLNDNFCVRVAELVVPK
ncbi:MAG: flagellar motor switch protein FliN [Thermoguttaceae bacterium]|nr:flagellar motor switch protein FliN [Thermoguttaceae bacterium]MDW8079294.1 flagellar motor switch protein FliN [Thermoguttaceae bacterium]